MVDLEPYFKNLDDREINSLTELELWLKDASEVEAAISEDACWRQIKMTCDTKIKCAGRIFQFLYDGNTA